MSSDGERSSLELQDSNLIRCEELQVLCETSFCPTCHSLGDREAVGLKTMLCKYEVVWSNHYSKESLSVNARSVLGMRPIGQGWSLSGFDGHASSCECTCL